MSANLPAQIFGDINALGVHATLQFGGRLNGQNTRQYEHYKSSHNAGFPVNFPVKSKVEYIGPNDQGDPSVLIVFQETIGIFHRGHTMLISGLTPIPAVTSKYNGQSERPIYNKGDYLGLAPVSGVSLTIGSQQSTNAGTNQVGSNTNPPPLNDGDANPGLFVAYSSNPNSPAYQNGASSSTSATGTNDSGSGTGTDAPAGTDVGTIAKAAAFSTFFAMPGIFDRVEAMHLEGQKSLLNDQPLLPFVEQLTNACLRHFMSTPSGDFFAFYPDYFGGLGKTAYWLIDDIEIISGSIELSDDELATHVYVVGDTWGPPSGADAGGAASVNWIDNIYTSGVVTVFNAFMADFLNGIDAPSENSKVKANLKDRPTLANYADAINFLKKYGARPHYEAQATVRAPIYEAFLAYQRFCLLWSGQFKTQFEFTFMPELFPGGLVAFPEHGLQCYVNSVTHNCSYESGFTTTAELTAPSAYKNNDGSVADPDKSWVHAGMIRSWPDTDIVGKFTGATDTDPAAKAKK
jgi:hypothetical protein